MSKTVRSEAETLQYVQSSLSYIARLLQYSEECAEASKAAQRIVRYLMQENPLDESDRDFDKLKEQLLNEHGDILTASAALGLDVDNTVITGKLQRWAQCLEDYNE